MPLTYTVDHEHHTIRAIASGGITLVDVEQHLVEERRDLGLSFVELIDGRASSVFLSPAETRRLVARLQALAVESTLGRTAVVVATDHDFGMMRMLEFLVSDFCEIRPFRSIELAEYWLAERSAPT